MQDQKSTIYKLEHVITSCRGAGVLRIKPDRLTSKTVILLHGLESSKEWSLTTMYGLARAGFDTIAIDLFLHGDRPDAAKRDSLLASDFIRAMRDIVYESANDVPKITSELGINFSECGLLGISAGGFTGHVIATSDKKPRAYVAAITSPDWSAINEDATNKMPLPLLTYMKSISPISKLKDYPPVALLQTVGMLDERVFPTSAIELNKLLQPVYDSAGLSDHLKLLTYPDVAHYFSSEMLDEAIAWFDKHL